MIDSFVLLAPIYLLGVIALVGFVGCAQVIGVDDWRPQGGPPPEAPTPPQAPTNVHGTPSDGVVTLFWDPYPPALLFEIDRKIAPPGPPPASYDFLDSVTPAELPTTVDGFLAYEDHTVTNGITYHYVVRAMTGDGTSENSGDIEATPKSNFGPFVMQFAAGTPRLGEDGWFGFAFVAVAQGVTVQKLGRFYSPSDSGTHEINIIEGASLQVLGTATVSPASEPLDGFMYADVKPSPVDLKPNDEYFVVSHEALGGDEFLTQDTTVTTRPEADVTNAIESATLVAFSPAGGPNHVYGPVNFQY